MNSLTLIEDSTTIKICTQDECVVLNRNTGYGSTSSIMPVVPQKKMEILGIYGLIPLKNSSYLICVTNAIKIGYLYEHDVYEVKRCKFVKFKTLNTKENDRKDLRKLKYFFKQPGLYFSKYPIYKSYADQECNEIDFLFNYTLVKEFSNIVRGNTEGFILNCMQGYFGNVKINDLELALISRRCWRRVGMRFMQRGCDDNGYCSNFVETEQIIYTNENRTCAFVQVRGSIPLKWKNKISINLNPNMIVEDTECITKADQIFRDHYGELVYINLIQNKNLEKNINDVYKKELLRHNYSHINFDFKNEGLARCLKTRNKFVKDLDRFIRTQGVTTNDNLEQNGIIRTNCIDCLDRTNIIQFLIAFEAMKIQLNNLDYNNKEILDKILLENNSKIENKENNNQESDISNYREKKLLKNKENNGLENNDLESNLNKFKEKKHKFFNEENSINRKTNTNIFNEDRVSLALRKLWFQNGNFLSVQYSGTPSLQSQIITGGTLSNSGKFKDGYYSLKRYVLNRFYHGNLQDGYQLATGNYLHMGRNKRFRFNHKLFLVALLISIISFYNLSKQGVVSETAWLYGTISIMVGYISLYFILFDYFINYPSIVDQ
ncbi:hypothetical protein COBT_003435 [Conglomerata obtusa]